MRGSLNKGAFAVVFVEEVDHDANVLDTRFVLSLKNTETDKPLFKARFVVQGHTDAKKGMLVDRAKNVRKNSVRLLVSITAVFGFRIRSQDVS